MTKINQIICVILLSLTFVSCNFTENIDVQADGSGNFSIEMDGAGLLAMAGDKLGNELGMKNNAKAIDSTFSFKEIFESKKDSIAKLSPEQQSAFKKLESFVMNIKMNPEAQQLLFSMNTPFKKVNDLGGLMESMAAMKDLNGKSNKTAEMFSGFGNDNSKLTFSYDGKQFTRKAIVSKEAMAKIAADSTGMAKMIFASSKYTLKYHFPKAVKSVSNPDALFSADRKTITVEYPFTEYTENPEKLNLNVVFE
ncbi:hypothetical protein B6A10_13260 [Flavobacterium sp. L1I52]|uniref:DUF4292 domain-containing protein n=1 Tax=Flavobacterium pokkalii TaxID=1940408 RepID=A0ABR7UUT5_9FLAO|nr:hypothetical protein [Flavobacterium pokkalii]MBD0726142.1 hypothetical protein [Flavobacterium pokkalii]